MARPPPVCFSPPPPQRALRERGPAPASESGGGTLEEETHSDGFIHAVVDERGELLSLDKASGGADMDGSTLNSCVQAAIKRHGEVLPLLAEALGYDPTASPS